MKCHDICLCISPTNLIFLSDPTNYYETSLFVSCTDNAVIKETNNLRVNINDFRVKTLIGKGYFGDVHLATENVTNDVYAIKKILKSGAITTSQLKEERDIMAIATSEWITSLQYAFQVIVFSQMLSQADFLFSIILGPRESLLGYGISPWW